METKVRCDIYDGFFDSEYTVQVMDGTDILWQGWVDKSLVEHYGSGCGQPWGYLKAELIDLNDEVGIALVEFPVDGLASRRAKVPLNLLS